MIFGMKSTPTVWAKGTFINVVIEVKGSTAWGKCKTKQKIIKKHYPLSQNSFGHLNNFRLLHKSITLNIYIYWIDFALMLAVISRIIHISMCIVKHGCLEVM